MASTPANAKVQLYLAVPFDQKDRAKAVGARWDPAAKKWYVPHGVDIAGFAEWWPDELRGQSADEVTALLAAEAAARPKRAKPAAKTEAPVVTPAVERGPPPPIDPNDPPPWL